MQSTTTTKQQQNDSNSILAENKGELQPKKNRKKNSQKFEICYSLRFLSVFFGIFLFNFGIFCLWWKFFDFFGLNFDKKF